MDLLFEDVGYFDLTTEGLSIGDKKGKMLFAPKSKIVLCGADEVVAILNTLHVEYKLLKQDAQEVEAGETILECTGSAAALHKAWKVCQNIFESLSGIATYTHEMVQKAQKINPNIVVATTRKTFPGTKTLALKAVMCGGGVIHRLGLYDSILIFEQHLIFLDDKEELEKSIYKLKHKFLEKKIAVEVHGFEDAFYFASLGADILQCEKMDMQTLQKCVDLKKMYPNLLLSATGGIHKENVEEFAKCGVDFIVTTAPYHAKPLDVKVTMQRA